MNRASSPEQALYRAASNGDLQSINVLLSQELVELQSLRNTQLDPIYAAVRNNRPHVLSFFLKSDVTISSCDYVNFLSIACHKGYENMVRFILGKTTNLKNRRSRLFTALQIAAQEDHESIVRVLILHGAFPSKDPKDNYHIAAHCLSTFKSFITLKTLIRRIPDVNFSLNDRSYLELVIEKNSLKLATQLIKKGAKITFEVFFAALNKGNPKMLDLLLENSDRQHVRWLFLKACELGDVDCVEVLLYYGADPHVLNEHHQNALFCCYMHIEVVELLLKFKVDPNQRDRRGMTPLHEAVSHNCQDSSMILISYGADMNLRDHHGVSPLHLACKLYDGQMLSLLLMNRDLDLNNHVDEMGRGLFFYARSCEVWNLLLYYGVNFKDVELPQCTHGSNIVLCKKLSYFRKMHLLGFELEVLRNEYRNIDEEDLKDYKLEIEAMRVMVVSYYPKRSMFDLLFDKRGKISKFLRRNEFYDVMHECDGDFEAMYPHFGFAYNLMVQREMLIRQAFVELSCMVGTFISKRCTDKIFSYLNETELRTFVDF